MCWSVFGIVVAWTTGTLSGRLLLARDRRFALFVLVLCQVQLADLALRLLPPHRDDVGCSAANRWLSRGYMAVLAASFVGAWGVDKLHKLVVACAFAVGALWVYPGARILLAADRGCTSVTPGGFLNWFGVTGWRSAGSMWWAVTAVAMHWQWTRARAACFVVGFLEMLAVVRVLPDEAFAESWCLVAAASGPVYLAVFALLEPPPRATAVAVGVDAEGCEEAPLLAYAAPSSKMAAKSASRAPAPVSECHPIAHKKSAAATAHPHANAATGSITRV